VREEISHNIGRKKRLLGTSPRIRGSKIFQAEVKTGNSGGI